MTIPESVTSIGDCAFLDCHRLATVTIPESVTSIGDCAFYNCRSLTTVTIPESVASIGDCAFYNCRSLTTVTIPASVASIGNCAFYNCHSLKYIIIKATDEEEFNRVKGLLPDDLKPLAAPAAPAAFLENSNKCLAIKEKALNRLLNSPLINPLYQEMLLGSNEGDNILLSIPVELFSMINQFSVGAESPTYLKALNKINEIKQPLCVNATDEAIKAYEDGCNKIVDQALQEADQLIQKNKRVALLVSHINEQYKPNQASSSGATFFATDKPSYSNKIGNISQNEDLSPSEKLKAITQETQNHINELAKDASGEKLSELIHAVTGDLPEKDKINDILDMAKKAKEENQFLKIGNLRTKLWDFAGKLASKQKDADALSKSI